jgi:hypothetical protein
LFATVACACRVGRSVGALAVPTACHCTSRDILLHLPSCMCTPSRLFSCPPPPPSHTHTRLMYTRRNFDRIAAIEAGWHAKQAAMFSTGQQQQQQQHSGAAAAAVTHRDPTPPTGRRPDSGQRRRLSQSRLEPIDLSSAAATSASESGAASASSAAHAPAQSAAASASSSSPSSSLLTSICGRRAEVDASRVERSKRRVRTLARELGIQEDADAEEKRVLLMDKMMRSSVEERRIAMELTVRRDEERVMRDNVLFR